MSNDVSFVGLISRLESNASCGSLFMRPKRLSETPGSDIWLHFTMRTYKAVL